MPPEDITLAFEDGSQTPVSVELEAVPIGGEGGMSTSLKVADMGPTSPLRVAAQKTLRPSGPVGVVVHARTAQIANAVVAALKAAGGAHKPSIRIAPNLAAI